MKEEYDATPPDTSACDWRARHLAETIRANEAKGRGGSRAAAFFYWKDLRDDRYLQRVVRRELVRKAKQRWATGPAA